MLISNELANAINEQVGHELHAAHQYVNIAAYFESLGLRLMAKRFYEQAEEEHEHAMKFVHYVAEAGGHVSVPAVDMPKDTFASVEEAVALSLDWELEVTRRINALMALAIQQNDYIGQDFLRWFVTEQLEEVSTMDNLLRVVRMAGERNLIMLEAYIAHGD